jgi:phosphoribosylformylglycinamidine (FGAM) synthase-like amidotransferase family enzyme
MAPRVLILRAPGTNCDRETAFAFETAGARAESVHLNRFLENPRLAEDSQILCIPGGFSYGDDICAGRIFGNQMRHHLRDALFQFKDAGKLIVGICNGFQVLIKSGVLLPDRAHEPLVTLALNASGKFEDRWVNLRVQGAGCVFLQGIDDLYLPVAHAEGRFVARDAATLAALDAAGQLVLRYCQPPEQEPGDRSQETGVRSQETGVRSQETGVRSQETGDSANLSASSLPAHHSPLTPQSAIRNPQSEILYPYCPNGAQLAVAGVCDESGRVFGLMPHPERHIDPTQHPRWTRERRDRGDGLAIFENAVRYFR